MKKSMIRFAVPTILFAAVGSLMFGSSPAIAQGASCEAQCKVEFNTCARAATNPGGLNQCRKALEACLEFCAEQP